MSKKSTGSTTHTDLARLTAIRDADIAHDEDNPITMPDDWDGAVMKRGATVLGTVRVRGTQKAPTKIATSIRLSADVLEYFKSTGAGWQTKVDEALRDYVQAHSR